MGRPVTLCSRTAVCSVFAGNNDGGAGCLRAETVSRRWRLVLWYVICLTRSSGNVAMCVCACGYVPFVRASVHLFYIFR